MKDIFIFFPPCYQNFQIHIPVNLKIKNSGLNKIHVLACILITFPSSNKLLKISCIENDIRQLSIYRFMDPKIKFLRLHQMKSASRFYWDKFNKGLVICIILSHTVFLDRGPAITPLPPPGDFEDIYFWELYY